MQVEKVLTFMITKGEDLCKSRKYGCFDSASHQILGQLLRKSQHSNPSGVSWVSNGSLLYLTANPHYVNMILTFFQRMEHIS